MKEGRKEGFLCQFQQYFSHSMATANIVHIFPVPPVQCWDSEVSCPRTLQQQTQSSQRGSVPLTQGENGGNPIKGLNVQESGFVKQS